MGIYRNGRRSGRSAAKRLIKGGRNEIKKEGGGPRRLCGGQARTKVTGANRRRKFSGKKPIDSRDARARRKKGNFGHRERERRDYKGGGSSYGERGRVYRGSRRHR